MIINYELLKFFIDLIKNSIHFEKYVIFAKIKSDMVSSMLTHCHNHKSKIRKMNKLLLTLSIFSILLSITSCGNSNENDTSKLEKEKLELEKRKLELEEAKFNAEQNRTPDNLSKANEDLVDLKRQNSYSSKHNPAYTYLLGKWNGKLRDKNFTIVLENINGKSVTGYNIAGKNKRPIKGLIYEDDRMGEGECGGMMETYKLVLSEPGDDKWDGVFTLYFSKCPEMDENGNEIDVSYFANGSWKANTGKLNGDVHVSK